MLGHLLSNAKAYALSRPLIRRLERYHRFFLKRSAARWVEKIRLSNWTILEIGLEATSRRRKAKNYLYLQAEKSLTIPPADLVVFLELADRKTEEELSTFLSGISSRRILFSFCEAPPAGSNKIGFAKSKARNFHRAERVSSLLDEHGYKHSEIRSLAWFYPAKLVLAQRSQTGRPQA